jgi:hypothetical protein
MIIVFCFNFGLHPRATHIMFGLIFVFISMCNSQYFCSLTALAKECLGGEIQCHINQSINQYVIVFSENVIVFSENVIVFSERLLPISIQIQYTQT